MVSVYIAMSYEKTQRDLSGCADAARSRRGLPSAEAESGAVVRGPGRGWKVPAGSDDDCCGVGPRGESAAVGTAHGGFAANLTRPVLAVKVRQSGGLAFVGGNEGEAEGEGVSGDQQIVAADHLAFILVVRAQQTVSAIGRFFEEHDLDGAEDSIDLGAEAR